MNHRPSTAENSAEAQEFKATAQALRNDFDFAISTVPANGAQLGSVVLYKSFDEKVVTFKGDIKKDALVSFIEGESLPVFGEIGPENFQLVSAYKYCTICFMKTMI
jgi:hypothetical protein